jgi:hypothetical protein
LSGVIPLRGAEAEHRSGEPVVKVAHGAYVL